MVAIWIAKTPGADQKRARKVAFLQDLPAVANIAHRGASARATEHSWRAYELALEAGADILELDLRLLRDNTLVVAHDSDLLRILKIATELRAVSWEELNQLAGQAAPLRLQNVLARFPGVRFNLELKDEVLSAAGELATLLQASGSLSRVLVASAHHELLVAFRRLTQGAVATSASMREVLRFHANYWLGTCESTPFVALQIPTLSWLGLDSAGLLRHARECGIVVHYWTLDKEEDMRRVIAAGANGVMSNYPGRLASVLQEGGRQ